MNDEQPLSAEAQWQNFCDAMAEIEGSLSDEEVLAEMRAEGKEPTQEGEHVRQILRQAIQMVQRKKLDEAKREYAQRMTKFAKKNPALPETPEARRSLLAAVFAQHPTIQSAVLTVHHRDLIAITDSDVATYLEDLSALGVLEGVDDASGESA